MTNVSAIHFYLGVLSMILLIVTLTPCLILLKVKFTYISKWNDISNKNHTKNSTADTCVTTLVGIYMMGSFWSGVNIHYMVFDLAFVCIKPFSMF